MTAFQTLKKHLLVEPRRWLVTGGAGFIGSHIVETLLDLGQHVTVADNFSTGHAANLDAVHHSAEASSGNQLELIEADLCDAEACRRACAESDYVLHQAALGSVPRSIDNPIASHAANVTATVNLLTAAKDAGVRRVVYASSSSVYGDEPTLPKVENLTGDLLSPYAATKAVCELYAEVFARSYGLETIGLRYFNIFGPRQDPEGPYAAVIPKWIQAMHRGEAVTINGDGSTSRDFTYVGNAVQANLLAATVDSVEAINRIYNVAVGSRTTLNELAERIRTGLQRVRPDLDIPRPQCSDFRDGDVKHSQADISEANIRLGYQPQVDLEAGLGTTIEYYARGADD